MATKGRGFFLLYKEKMDETFEGRGKGPDKFPRLSRKHHLFHNALRFKPVSQVRKEFPKEYAQHEKDRIERWEKFEEKYRIPLLHYESHDPIMVQCIKNCRNDRLERDNRKSNNPNERKSYDTSRRSPTYNLWGVTLPRPFDAKTFKLKVGRRRIAHNKQGAKRLLRLVVAWRKKMNSRRIPCDILKYESKL